MMARYFELGVLRKNKPTFTDVHIPLAHVSFLKPWAISLKYERQNRQRTSKEKISDFTVYETFKVIEDT